MTQPIAGPRFRHVAALQIEGAKRRKVLALLAAFEDGGQPSTDALALAERLGWDRRKVDVLLRRLHADGYISPSRNTAKRKFPRYRIAGEHRPAEQRPQEAAA